MQVTSGRDDGLESATYLGSVAVTEPEPAVGDNVTSVGAPYLQFVENTGDICGPGGVYTTGPGTVYVSPSLYPASSSPSTTTYYDTTGYSSAGLTSSGANTQPGSQSQLVSYAGSTFLIQPSPDGSSTPLITAVTTRADGTESPGLVGGGQPGEVSPSHSLSYATRVSPATIQWLISNYETAEGVSLPRSTLYNHYLKHCNESNIIRSPFKTLRRLLP